jgi:hypothetical protein
MAWKIMLGYIPTNASRRSQTLERKRAEYKDTIAQHYDIDDDSRTMQEQETLRQVLVDVPRTAPDVPLFRNEKVRRALARLLFIWAMRHPASSYVQGINDLATPLFAVFLSDYYNGEDVVLDGNIIVLLTDERIEEVSKQLPKRRCIFGTGVKVCHLHTHTFHSFLIVCMVCTVGGSGCVLVYHKYSSRNSRPLHSRPAGCTANGDAARRVGQENRCRFVRAFATSWNSIYAICL